MLCVDSHKECELCSGAVRREARLRSFFFASLFRNQQQRARCIYRERKSEKIWNVLFPSFLRLYAPPFVPFDNTKHIKFSREDGKNPSSIDRMKRKRIDVKYYIKKEHWRRSRSRFDAELSLFFCASDKQRRTLLVVKRDSSDEFLLLICQPHSMKITQHHSNEE